MTQQIQLAALKPHPDMVEFVKGVLLHETSEHLAWDEAGLEGILLSVSAHEMLQGHASKIKSPDRVRILNGKGNFIYVELMYRDSTPEEIAPGEIFIAFERQYKYLVDIYSQAAMLTDTKF